jgi:hypothetical protein
MEVSNKSHEEPLIPVINLESYINTPNEKSNYPETKLISSQLSDQKNLSLEDIFVNLSLISKIESGDKIILNDKHINIDSSYFQFFTRWINGSGRNETIQFISMILNKAFEHNDRLIGESTDASAQLLFRLNSDLKNSINGLNNLKQTYSMDKLIQSEIDVFIDDIRSKLDLNSKHLNFKKN